MGRSEGDGECLGGNGWCLGLWCSTWLGGLRRRRCWRLGDDFLPLERTDGADFQADEFIRDPAHDAELAIEFPDFLLGWRSSLIFVESVEKVVWQGDALLDGGFPQFIDRCAKIILKFLRIDRREGRLHRGQCCAILAEFGAVFFKTIFDCLEALVGREGFLILKLFELLNLRIKVRLRFVAARCGIHRQIRSGPSADDGNKQEH